MAADDLPPSAAEDSIRRFERDWLAGDRRPLDVYLPPRSDPGYAATLEELVCVEMELRWRARAEVAGDPSRGEDEALPCRVEQYCEKFEELGKPARLLRLAQQEYEVRCRFSRPPTIDEYRRRFPGLEITLQKLRVSDPFSIIGYEVEEELGRGGMGVVYRVRQQSTGRRLALKMILCGRGATFQELARFRIEAEAMACLNHPNIIKIRDVGVAAGCPFFVLDWAERGSLKDWLRKQTPREPLWCADLVRTLALAMQHAHGRGMLHRDLKPANILMMGDGTPKISDFGLVKFAAPVAKVSQACCTSSARAFALAYRCSGFFSRHFKQIVSNLRGNSGRNLRGGTGWTL